MEQQADIEIKNLVWLIDDDETPPDLYLVCEIIQGENSKLFSYTVKSKYLQHTLWICGAVPFLHDYPDWSVNILVTGKRKQISWEKFFRFYFTKKHAEKIARYWYREFYGPPYRLAPIKTIDINDFSDLDLSTDEY